MPQHNKISNPKPPTEPMVKGPAMNDRDRLNDILLTEKYLVHGLNIAAIEASHDVLHQDIMLVLNETHECAREIYTIMFQNGWYTLEAEQQSALDQTYQQFSGYSSQFPYSMGTMQ
jgi:spore coat protein CotF